MISFSLLEALLITSECDTVKFDFLFFLLCFNLVFSISDCFLGLFALFRQPVIIRIHNYAIFLNRVWYSDSWNIYLNYSVFMIIWYLYINIFIWHLLLRYSIHGLINWSNVFWTIHTFRYLFYWKYTNPRLSFKKKGCEKTFEFRKRQYTYSSKEILFRNEHRCQRMILKFIR